MPYNIAGIGVHKKMLHVVFSDVEVAGEYQFVRRRSDTSPSQLRCARHIHLSESDEVSDSDVGYDRGDEDIGSVRYEIKRAAHFEY